MPDISMCLNTECPKRMDCYRYRAVPGDYQTFAAFLHENCKDFLRLEKDHRAAGIPFAEDTK